MTDQQAFLGLSAELTGFGVFDLAATGLTDLYFETVTANIGPDTRCRLYDIWRDIEALPTGDRVQAVADRIMAAPVLADAARRIIALWYVGSWYAALPGGSSVLTPASYVEGLMWKAIGAHPMGAKPQGYGAWVTPPPTVTGESR